MNPTKMHGTCNNNKKTKTNGPSDANNGARQLRTATGPLSMSE